MKNLLPNATDDFRRLNPHLFTSGNVQGNVARSTGIRKGMNKTEREFSLLLAAQLVKGEITEWKFEAVKLKIGEGCWYTPDFMVTRPLRIGNQVPYAYVTKFIETKGFLRDDARVKFLAAQEQHKWATFEMYRKDRKQGWTQIL